MRLQQTLMKEFVKNDIYGITDSPHSGGRTTIEVVQAMLDAGIGIIQYREKDKTPGEKYRECKVIRKMTRKVGALFIVNDHPDLAIIVEADGVHIGQNDYPPGEIRKLIGHKMILGLSTHSPSEALRAEQTEVVDYIGVGPLFFTNTKRDVCQPVGLEYLDFVVGNINLPFVAIGGIKANNISQVAAHGAKIIAAVTEITAAPDIKSAVSTLRAKMRQIPANTFI